MLSADEEDGIEILLDIQDSIRQLHRHDITASGVYSIVNKNPSKNKTEKARLLS